jgi:hypothetical protein
MEPSRKMPKRPPPEFEVITRPRGNRLDPIISWLRNDKTVAAIYTWLTDTFIPLVLAVVIVLPVGTLLLLFYLPKFYRNWKRRHKYGVEVVSGTWSSSEHSSPETSEEMPGGPSFAPLWGTPAFATGRLAVFVLGALALAGLFLWWWWRAVFGGAF